MKLKQQLATIKSWANTWINTTKNKIKYNTISTNNNQGCKIKENKMWRTNELILSATRRLYGVVARIGGWREEVLQDGGEAMSCWDSKVNRHARRGREGTSGNDNWRGREGAKYEGRDGKPLAYEYKPWWSFASKLLPYFIKPLVNFGNS